MNKKFNLNVKFKKDETFQHPEMIKVEVWIATYGLNANNSNISKEAFEEAIESLYNIPIVGEYKENIEDFGGHGGKIVIEDDTITMVDTTKPYGVVPESCNPRWEYDENNVEYLVCDAYIWTGRYEEAKVIEDGNCNQSMEINATATHEENGICYIDSFYFSALCILGVDTEPCFPSAKIVYSLNKTDFKKEFSLMLDEIKKIERGVNVDREKLLAKFSKLKGTKEYEALVNDSSLSLEDLETKLFSLSVNDLRRRIRTALEEITCTHTYSWGETYESQKFYFEDILIEENIVIVESAEKWYTYYGIPYTLDNDTVNLDVENAIRYIRGDWRPFIEGTDTEANSIVFNNAIESATNKINSLTVENDENKQKCFDLQEELNTVKEKYTKAESEVEELKQFKLDIETKEVKAKVDKEMAKFEAIKDIESCSKEFNEIYEKRYEYQLDDLIKTMKIFCFDHNINLSELNKEKEVKSNNGLKSFSLDGKDSNKIVNTEWCFLDQYIKE